jgi:hypothetical protein
MGGARLGRHPCRSLNAAVLGRSAHIHTTRRKRDRQRDDDYGPTAAAFDARADPAPAPCACCRAARSGAGARAPARAGENRSDSRPVASAASFHAPSKIERDQAGFAKEVAQLNKENDPHAIPTIDPGSQESASKDYAFAVPSSLRGSEHGNGIITPTRHWRDNGRDCYYGRYEFTYPDGSEEDGEIVWPFCYDPGADPFTQPPHQIPFPFPLAGFKLPPDTQLPPIEKSVYQQWVADPGLSSP